MWEDCHKATHNTMLPMSRIARSSARMAVQERKYKKCRTCTVHSKRSVPHDMGVAIMEPSLQPKPTPQAAAGAADQLPSTAGATALAVKDVLKATYPAAVFATAANYADQVRKRRCH